MIIFGIDVAKDKHDCFICNTEVEVLKEAFTITNELVFLKRICKTSKSLVFT